MKKTIFDPITRENRVSMGLLIYRVLLGGMMLTHGLPKLMGFSERMDSFPDPLGIGSTLSLMGTITGEVVAAILIMIGFATRISASVMGFTMAVAGLIVHSGDPFGTREKSLLFLAGCILLIFSGGGKYSVDNSISN